MANGLFGGGDGTIQNPYLIEDADDFFEIRKEPYAFYKLVSSINLMECSFLGDAGWVPSAFAGSLEGNGFSIEQCKITTGSDIGLFTFLRGVVRNVQLIGFDIKGSQRIGALAGRVEQVRGVAIENCAVIDSKIEGSSYVGSFAGSIFAGETHNSYSTATITTTNGNRVGGLFGSVDSNTSIKAPVISNSYFAGSIKGASNNVGGLVGEAVQRPVVVSSYYNSEIGFNNLIGEGKTYEEMLNPAIYVGWDIPMANHLQKVWSISEGALPELYYNAESKFLIYGGGKYFKLDGDNWVELSEELPAEEVFETQGLSEGELAGVPGYVWNKLRIHRTIELVNLRERYRVDSIFDHKVLENQGQVTDGFLLKATIDLNEYGDALGRIYFRY